MVETGEKGDLGVSGHAFAHASPRKGPGNAESALDAAVIRLDGAGDDIQKGGLPCFAAAEDADASRRKIEFSIQIAEHILGLAPALIGLPDMLEEDQKLRGES